MIRYKTPWLLAVLLISANLLQAQTPSVLNYQGRVTVADAPFNGQGNFTFVILDSQGVILWASGEFPFEGTTKMPAAVVKAPVNNGVYSVRLGDTTAGMPALDAALLRNSSSPRLRVWFNDGVRGWRVAGEEVSLAPALGMAGDANGALNGAQADSILRELRDLRAKLDRQQANPAPQPQPAAPTIATVSV
ncbi:MAG: hypothetical protein JWR69_95, partial [Pedosphaera sp.]|nr:hypothetical protein [Pedosphaera sp.]